ncbi:tetratricopeptide repeat protein [Myxococcota bacterium]|nr:tetratricopeptide repeat protein [Myxococcota bacterium]MBU1379386.1 tetratricopeptide repeat protein [Myxococcota bacterium]MBU1496788.1 tetratricopeptide repeat protein [Myxococcota bacterium]
MKIFSSILIIAILIPGFVSAQDTDVSIETAGTVKAKGVKVVSNKIEAPLQSKNFVDQTTNENAEKAREIFKRANKNFEDRNLPVALNLYKQAYKQWPHPRIVFNMGVTLSMMSRPREAALMFKKVLELGPDPVEGARYKEAKEKYMELMGTLAIVRFRAEQQGVQVYVDGNIIGTGPFTKEIILTSGRHLVTANLTGHVGLNEDIQIPAGVVAERAISLKKFEPIVKYKKVKRFGNLWPILTGVSSALILGGGGTLIYQGRSEIDDLQSEYNDLLLQSLGQPVEFDISRQDSPIMKQNVGNVLVGVGIAGIVATAVLFIIQEKQVQYTVTPDSNTESSSASE